MRDSDAEFQFIDFARAKPKRDARLASIEAEYCKVLANERRDHWIILGIIAVAYTLTVIGTALAIRWLLS